MTGNGQRAFSRGLAGMVASRARCSRAFRLSASGAGALSLGIGGSFAGKVAWGGRRSVCGCVQPCNAKGKLHKLHKRRTGITLILHAAMRCRLVMTQGVGKPGRGRSCVTPARLVRCLPPLPARCSCAVSGHAWRTGRRSSRQTHAPCCSGGGWAGRPHGWAWLQSTSR